MSDTSQGPGWWQASDGKWYPPEQAPAVVGPAATGERWEYTTQVNKKSLNMAYFAQKLNEQGRQGWRLHTAFEQDGNTVMVFERRVS